MELKAHLVIISDTNFTFENIRSHVNSKQEYKDKCKSTKLRHLKFKRSMEKFPECWVKSLIYM